MAYSIINGDLEPDMEIQAVSNGSAAPLEDTDVLELHWKKPDGTVTWVPLVPVDLDTGTVKRVWLAGDTDQSGTHYGRIRVTHLPPDSGATLTLTVVASVGTFTRATGSFITDKFGPGMTVVFSGFTASAGANNVTKIIASVTALVITVTDTTGLVDETGTGNERVLGDTPEPQTYPSDGSRIIWNIYDRIS